MVQHRILVQIAIAVLCVWLAPAQAQPAASAPAPRLVRFSGALKDRLGRPLTGVVGLTFALYKDQQGGAPLWLETQNAELDEQGRYTALLGATQGEGLPLELFTSGEPRWLGVQVILPGVEEEPRVLLVSVPYALKAADAETLGGKPLGAFVLAEPEKSGQTKALQSGGPGPVAVNSGNAGYIGKFVNTSDLGNSLLYDTGANVGIGTTSPAEALQVNGNLLLAGQPSEVLQVIGAASSGRLGQDGNGFFFASDTAGKSVRFLTSNGTLNEWMNIASNGNVGIGTATPGQKLEVNGNLRLIGQASHVVQVIGADSSGRLGEDSTGFFFASDTNGKSLRFLTNNGALNEWMFITSSGNVGIGTSTPSAKLHIGGTVGVDGIRFPDGTLQTTACGTLSFGTPSLPAGRGPLPAGIACSAASLMPMVQSGAEAYGGILSPESQIRTLQEALREQQLQMQQLKAEVENLKEKLDALLRGTHK